MALSERRDDLALGVNLEEAADHEGMQKIAKSRTSARITRFRRGNLYATNADNERELGFTAEPCRESDRQSAHDRIKTSHFNAS